MLREGEKRKIIEKTPFFLGAPDFTKKTLEDNKIALEGILKECQEKSKGMIMQHNTEEQLSQALNTLRELHKLHKEERRQQETIIDEIEGAMKEKEKTILDFLKESEFADDNSPLDQLRTTYSLSLVIGIKSPQVFEEAVNNGILTPDEKPWDIKEERFNEVKDKLEPIYEEIRQKTRNRLIRDYDTQTLQNILGGIQNVEEEIKNAREAEECLEL